MFLFFCVPYTTPNFVSHQKKEGKKNNPKKSLQETHTYSLAQDHSASRNTVQTSLMNE